ncbi:hypothetical protein BBO_09084 [Beauveria brongniartii RCEF 3172]|uniref:Uncharacterized protein n=1 Tax=Beauveria brongniartii RCEF 3172 TaxID=1081107 RepID=A0A166WI19_9HYPO|nr:hypothetical protein BBO_09084 [Beauveria brongniartii RCEF 3172]
MHFSATAKSFGLLALALPPSVAAQSTFNLFAYGTEGGISAASLFYENGHIMVSNLTTPLNLTSVYFTRQSNSPSAWTVQPNETANPDASFTPGYVGLKASTNFSLVEVGNAADDALDLLLFGQSVFARSGDKMQNPFYGMATNTTGIWQLVWSPEDTQADQLEPVILRLTRPPRPDGRK